MICSPRIVCCAYCVVWRLQLHCSVAGLSSREMPKSLVFVSSGQDRPVEKELGRKSCEAHQGASP